MKFSKKFSIKFPMKFRLRFPRIALPKIGLPQKLRGALRLRPPWWRKAGAAAPVEEAPIVAAPEEGAPEGATSIQAEAVEATAPKKSRKKMLLIAAGGALALMALGAGGWFFVAPWLGWRGGAAPEAQANGETPANPSAAGHDGSHDESHDESHGEPGKTSTAQKDGGSPAATEPPAPPSEVEGKVRRLQDVEEKVASGDPAALAEMPHLIHSLSQEFAALPPATWAQSRNARALALYLLSGGESALGRKILAIHDPTPAEPALLKGAVAYLEGVDSREREGLLDLDPRKLDPGLGAQLAFVQSILLARYDRRHAMAQLDLARLLAPGGLVEEAALRREIGLASELNDVDRFAALSRQYWMRFRASPYAENFLRQFAAAAARSAQSIGVEQWIQFDEFIDALSPQRRQQLFLSMARSAAVAGNNVFADFSARRALGLTAPGSPEALRARLYGAMANVAGPQSRDNAAILTAIDRSALPEGDQPLYDATALVAVRLYRAPPQDFAAPPEGAGDLSGAEFARAQTDLAAADASLDAARLSMERKTR